MKQFRYPKAVSKTGFLNLKSFCFTHPLLSFAIFLEAHTHCTHFKAHKLKRKPKFAKIYNLSTSNQTKHLKK